MLNLKIYIIGLGGIGSILSEILCRFLNYSNDIISDVVLVDGDTYEEKNFERQEFANVGKKSAVKLFELGSKYQRISFNNYEEFITPENISTIIRDDSIIFLCVDNHKTRMIVSNYCKTLNDVTLISGGNDYTDGNVQIYKRRGGKDITPDLCTYHPEIATPDDKLPTEMSCEELSKSAPQLYFTNAGAGILMCWSFYNVVLKEQYAKSEIYFDIQRMSMDPKERRVKSTVVSNMND